MVRTPELSTTVYDILARRDSAESLQQWRALSDDQRESYFHYQRRQTAYKTSMCRYFVQSLPCKYGESCSFAHGMSEIRVPPRQHPKFKTQLCRNFTYEGSCAYGPRCCYVHRSDSSAPATSAAPNHEVAALTSAAPNYEVTASESAPNYEVTASKSAPNDEVAAPTRVPAPPSQLPQIYYYAPAIPYYGFDSSARDAAAAIQQQQRPSPSSSPIMMFNNDNSSRRDNLVPITDFFAQFDDVFPHVASVATNLLHNGTRDYHFDLDEGFYLTAYDNAFSL